MRRITYDCIIFVLSEAAAAPIPPPAQTAGAGRPAAVFLCGKPGKRLRIHMDRSAVCAGARFELRCVSDARFELRCVSDV